MSAIRLLKPIEPEPNVVRYLEEALEDARSGKLRGIVLMARDANGLSYTVAGVEDRFAVVGYLTNAIYKLQEL